jgi:hypothetical protein
MTSLSDLLFSYLPTLGTACLVVLIDNRTIAHQQNGNGLGFGSRRFKHSMLHVLVSRLTSGPWQITHDDFALRNQGP